MFTTSAVQYAYHWQAVWIPTLRKYVCGENSAIQIYLKVVIFIHFKLMRFYCGTFPDAAKDWAVDLNIAYTIHLIHITFYWPTCAPLFVYKNWCTSWSVKGDISFFFFLSHFVDCTLWCTCIIKTNKMHFSFLIYFNNLSSTCFK